MSDIGTWFNSLPIFTRWWFSLTGIFTLGGRFGLFRAYDMILYYEAVVDRFQIWRPLTCLFYYPLSPASGFHFLINCYFLISYSKRLESEEYSNRPADYLFLLVFNWIVCVLFGLFAQISFLMDPMVLSVLYIWCQLNKDVIVNFWFGSRFKAMYLPWVLLGVNMILSGGGLMELVGILAGHLYYFLMYKYPQDLGGPRLLRTPKIFYNWFPSGGSHIRGFGQVPQTTGISGGGGPGGGPGGGRGRFNWHGRGHTLGGN